MYTFQYHLRWLSNGDAPGNEYRAHKQNADNILLQIHLGIGGTHLSAAISTIVGVSMLMSTPVTTGELSGSIASDISQTV